MHTELPGISRNDGARRNYLWKKNRLPIGRAQWHRENGTFVLGLQYYRGGETWNKFHCTFYDF